MITQETIDASCGNMGRLHCSDHRTCRGHENSITLDLRTLIFLPLHVFYLAPIANHKTIAV